MINFDEFLKSPQDVLEFKHNFYGIFKKDNRARESLNKTLETKYKAVYRKDTEYRKQWRFEGINWSGETFFILTEKGRILEHTNSEWGGIGFAKP